MLLRYGRGAVEVNVPERNVRAVLMPREKGELPNYGLELARSLKEPIGAEPLRNVVKPRAKVTIVTSDVTRPCPSDKILPPVLREVEGAGVRKEDVTILLATGTHRAHTAREKAQILGAEVASAYRVVDHDCKDKASMRFLGSTERGTPVYFNKHYLDADVKIAVGNVELHYFAGYSAGPKSILPGVAAYETVTNCHSMMVDPKATSGAAEGNPVYEDIVEGVGMAPPDFIVDVVLNQDKGIVGVFSGHYLEAHRKAMALVDEMYKVGLGERADVVVVSAGGFPKDINLYQAEKAVENACRAVREGGAILLVAECAEGFGHDVFKRWVFEARRPEDVIERLKKQFVLGGHKAYATMKVVEHCDVYLRSSIPADEVKRALLNPVDEPSQFLKEAVAKYGEGFSAVVMPYGGSTLPVVRG